jgi:hypothetical protein
VQTLGYIDNTGNGIFLTRFNNVRIRYNFYLYSPIFKNQAAYRQMLVQSTRRFIPLLGFTLGDAFTGGFARVICLNFKQYGACYFMLQEVK